MDAKGRGITQRMLATLTGTTEVSISRWENGSRLPNTDALYKLCKALDVSNVMKEVLET